jgi:hypothetical protein
MTFNMTSINISAPFDLYGGLSFKLIFDYSYNLGQLIKIKANYRKISLFRPEDSINLILPLPGQRNLIETYINKLVCLIFLLKFDLLSTNYYLFHSKPIL